MRTVPASTLASYVLLRALLFAGYSTARNGGVTAFAIAGPNRSIQSRAKRISTLRQVGPHPSLVTISTSLVTRLYDSVPSTSSLSSSIEEEETATIGTAFVEVDSATDHSSFLTEPGVTLHTLILNEHRPLGCTVEESLAVEDSNAVFVTFVKENGFAAGAGLQVGDVILGVSHLFSSGNNNGVDESVAGRIDQVKKLVSARPDHESLLLKVARGTQVLERHEAALAELCANPDADGEDGTEQCMLEYLQSSYYNADEGEGDTENCNPDEDEDCVLENIYNLWAEDDLPIGSAVGADDAQQQGVDEQKPIVKPWSSRASPSGTWVRDPRTGEMRNIS